MPRVRIHWLGGSRQLASAVAAQRQARPAELSRRGLHRWSSSLLALAERSLAPHAASCAAPHLELSKALWLARLHRSHILLRHQPVAPAVAGGCGLEGARGSAAGGGTSCRFAVHKLGPRSARVWQRVCCSTCATGSAPVGVHRLGLQAVHPPIRSATPQLSKKVSSRTCRGRGQQGSQAASEQAAASACAAVPAAPLHGWPALASAGTLQSAGASFQPTPPSAIAPELEKQRTQPVGPHKPRSPPWGTAPSQSAASHSAPLA